MRIFARVLAALVAVLAFARIAFAQDTALPLDDIFAPIRPYLAEIMSVLIVAFMGWLTTWLRSMFKVNLDEKHRVALHAALENAKRLAMEKMESAVKGKKVDVGNEVVKNGLEYVLKYSPDAIAYFGLTPEKVAEMLRAKVTPPPVSEQ